MPGVTTRLIPAVETYFAALRRVRASGGATGEQVSRYWTRYRLVLVTNTRDFVPVGEDLAKLESSGWRIAWRTLPVG